MGRKARRRQRAADLRKQPNASKREFVERKVKELQDMDYELQQAIGRETV